jgi:hypothetical protein
MTVSIPTGQIDQTHRALAATRPSLLTLPFRLLPTWALVTLALVGAFFANRLLASYRLHAKAERYRLERRRKAGIPDSDKREFRLAAADVLRARKDEDERREHERTLRKRVGRSSKGDWERFGTANGLRERPSQQRTSLFSFSVVGRRERAALSAFLAGRATPRHPPAFMYRGSRELTDFSLAQPVDREDSATPSIRYPSLAHQSSAISSPSAFQFGGERGATPASRYGDSDDERRELELREKLSRRARGEGFGE